MKIAPAGGCGTSAAALSGPACRRGAAGSQPSENTLPAHPSTMQPRRAQRSTERLIAEGGRDSCACAGVQAAGKEREKGAGGDARPAFVGREPTAAGSLGAAGQPRGDASAASHLMDPPGGRCWEAACRHAKHRGNAHRPTSGSGEPVGLGQGPWGRRRTPPPLPPTPLHGGVRRRSRCGIWSCGPCRLVACRYS